MADEITNVSTEETTAVNKTITKEWMDEYDGNLKTKGLQPLYERTLTPVLNAVPDESVLTYTKDGKTYKFHVGDEARVRDTENGDEELGYYVFYKLYDIVTEGSTTRAVWGLGGSGGGGGGALAKIRVDLKAWRNEAAIDPSALNGATITLTKAGDGSTVATATWAGSVVTFSKVPILLNGGTYTLTVSAKEGFSIDANGQQQASITGIAPDMGSDVTYTFNYRTRRYAVAYESNQGAADTVLQNKTVGYSGKSYTSQIDVPGTVTIAAGDLTPLADANGEYSASAAVSGYQITVSYRTCLVTFAPTLSDGDTAITDAQVTGTIGGKAVQRGGTVKIPIGTTGVKTVLNAITGYQTPTVADFDADAASKQIAPQYLTHVYQVSITSNQDTLDTLDPAVDRSTVYMLVRYTYNNETVNVGSQLKHGDTFKVPADADTSTIAVSSSSNVAGYNKPIAYSHVDGNYAVSLVYSTTKVWVSAASNQGSLPAGLAFTIDGTTVTPNDNTSFVKVPTGDPFTLTASDATHYRKVITNNGNASGASQEVHVQYDTTLVTLQMAGENNGVEGAAPTGAQGTVTYTDDNSQTQSQVLTDNTTPAYVPTGKHFAIAYGAVSGYGTPLDSTDYVASDASMQAQKAVYVYGVLKVEVAMSDQDDADLALVAATVAINGGTPQPMTGTIDTAAHKKVFQATLDAGDSYVVAFSPVSGYQTPASLNGTFAGGVQTLTADPYLTTVYTLQRIQTTKDGNVQGSNPQGVGCTLSYTGLQTPISLTTAGQTAKVPTNLVSSVVITPSTVYGYAASDEGSGQTIQLLYATTAYTLTVSTNQSDAQTVLAQTVIRVGDANTGLSQAGYLDFTGARTATEILVPAGTAITAALVSAQSGKPAAASYAESITVVGQVITVTYSQERLSIGLTADEGTPDLTGVTITVKNMTDAQNPVVLTTATGSLTAFGIAFRTPYTVELSGVEGYSTPQFNGGSARTAAAASYSEAMQYAKITVVSDYIILDQTSSDPTTKVKDSAGRTYSSGYTRPSVIDQIRAASHCYVGTLADGVMSLKQLDDTDGTKYADGTSAATDITGSTGKDVFMRLPIFFTRATEIETDKWRIEFAFDPSQVDANGQIISTTSAQPAGTGWVQWGGNDLIGKYEAYETGNKTYSRSGVTSTGNVSQANFKAHARARGTGYSIVKWRHQNIMAILFYAYYGHTNCQLLIGTGASSNNKNTGLKNSLGMTDTTSSNGNTDNIVFWGLENWWGNKYERVDNVVINSGTWVITEDDGTTRTLTAGTDCVTAAGAWVYPTKWVLGDNLDVIPEVGQTGGSDSQGYCDAVYIANSASRVVARSCNYAYAKGGVAFVNASGGSADTSSGIGSRLAFNGTIEIS